MNCPRCEDRVMQERDRDGVTIDLCPGCRGIWLDRGELEKLIARARAEADADAADASRALEHDGARRWRDDDDDDDDRFDDDDRRELRGRAGPQGRRKRRWFDSFGDLFE